MQVCDIWHYLRYLRKVIPGPSQKKLEKSPRNGTTRPWPHGCHNRASSGRGVSEKNAGKATQVTVRDLEHINENLIHFMENRRKTVIKDITGLATTLVKRFTDEWSGNHPRSPQIVGKKTKYSAPGNWETVFFVCMWNRWWLGTHGTMGCSYSGTPGQSTSVFQRGAQRIIIWEQLFKWVCLKMGYTPQL